MSNLKYYIDLFKLCTFDNYFLQLMIIILMVLSIIGLITVFINFIGHII